MKGELKKLKNNIKIFPLTWYVFSDPIYFEIIKQMEDEGKFNSFSVCTVLNDDDVKQVAEKIKNGENVIVFSTFLPPSFLEKIFITKRLPNAFGGLTFLEKNYCIRQKDPEKEQLRIMENKLKLKIHKPKLTLRDLKGASKLKREIEKIASTIDNPKLRVKGVFLIGIPGTGKSYSAKCCAGELNRWLIEMNLSKILEDEKPIELVYRIFEMLETLPHPSILWIDEIDKVFTGGEKETKLMGQLLTILNEFNTETGFKADAFFWVTANNVKQIVVKNPEFFRRFDYLFFVQTPKKKEAKEIFELYFKKYGVNPKLENNTDNDSISAIVRIIELYYAEFLEEKSPIPSDRFIYTPAEIERICKKLAIISETTKKDYFTRKEIEEVVRMNRPVVESMKEAIDSMLEQKKFFVEV